jgi:hypothetical protein
MSRTTRLLTTAAFIAGTAGAAMAQMAGGGMTGQGAKPGTMTSQMGSRMMGGQMMQAEMMHGMVGTMTQMNQIMERMAGSMGQGMDMRTLAGMSRMMEDMAGMMKEMAARMRDGKMSEAMLKRMNERMASMTKAMAALQAKGDTQ